MTIAATSGRWLGRKEVSRKLLYGVGVERGERAEGQAAGRRFSQEEALREMAGGGRLPLWQALRCRVRYFCDGGIIGSRELVDAAFERHRDRYGTARKTGARGMRGGEWGELRVLRDLRVEVFG